MVRSTRWLVYKVAVMVLRAVVLAADVVGRSIHHPNQNMCSFEWLFASEAQLADIVNPSRKNCRTNVPGTDV
jgi:hypothetical protein